MSYELSVNIRTAKRTFFQGNVISLTSVNDKGEFDVLYEHANFISLIRDCIIVNKGTSNERKFVITTGILKVEQNKVDVFLDV